MYPAGEAVGGFGLELLTGYRPAGIDEIPGCPFEQHIFGVFRNFAFHPAHHPGQRKRTSRIRHNNCEG